MEHEPAHLLLETEPLKRSFESAMVYDVSGEWNSPKQFTLGVESPVHDLLRLATMRLADH